MHLFFRSNNSSSSRRSKYLKRPCNPLHTATVTENSKDLMTEEKSHVAVNLTEELLLKKSTIAATMTMTLKNTNRKADTHKSLAIIPNSVKSERTSGM